MTATPEKIGRYRVVERVGRGGMGVLYRGVDPVLDREVAIKLMLTDFSDDAEQMRPRFYREARAAARLQHRNIVTIFEFAEEATTPYIVMEFLRGTSLAARLGAAPPLTLDEKLDVVTQLCAGLDYAHAQGVVHRDVKPANTFLLADGTVKLLDFGIAKVTTSTLTRQGDVLGSASYMSPEQVSGSESVDGRADIFSVGVVLYELLAGRKPFQADAPTAIIMKILHEDPPPLEGLVPNLPAQLVAAVKRALAKDPAQRFATAGELGRELQWIRKALQASGDAGAGLLDETRFADTDVLRGVQKELERSRKIASPARPASSGPAAAAASAIAATATAEAQAAALKKWAAPAGIGAVVLAGVVIAVVTLGRGTSSGNGGSDAGVTLNQNASREAALARDPAPPRMNSDRPEPSPSAAVVPAADTVEVTINSDPSGASIALDGRDLRQATPAAIKLTGKGPHRLRLSKRGYQSSEQTIGQSEVQRRSLDYSLKPIEAATIAVSITGTYPFEVRDGAKVISGASESHEIAVPAGRTLRLVAPEFFLDKEVRVEPPQGRRVEIQAPLLGSLNVLTRFETCTVKIRNRDLGYPPINRQKIAEGTYKIELICPNGQNQFGSAVVIAGQTATAKIP